MEKKQQTSICNSFFAFTLAEVLITLGIIGVVAALTIPTLMSNIQQLGFVSAWKKTYSLIEQAQKQIQNDNGNISSGFNTINFTATGGNNFRNGWLPYLKVLKTCDAGTSISNGCYSDNNGFQNMDNSAVSNYVVSGATSSIVLQDGTFLLLYPGVCTGTLCSDSYIFVDVNGSNKPNIFGKDVFVIRYSEQKERFYTFGALPEWAYLYSPECTGNGWTCGAYYLISK